MRKNVFWLFCTVIDNYGDIGVAWRLARELQARLNAYVYLWLDDFTALQTIAPDWQQQDIHVLSWQEGQDIDLTEAELPDVVIETFACRLPENVLHIIKQTHAAWLNWEYLSAEDWAVRTHLMPSLQHNGATKYFWQMGFLARTGGLLREQNYIEKQQAFFRQSESPNETKATRLQIAESIHHQEPHKHAANMSSAFRQPENPLRLFIFAYDSQIWAKWMRAWQSLGCAIELNIAGNQVIDALKRDGLLPENACNQGEPFISGSLKIVQQNFVPQTDFDTRLWDADIVIIRGEDSFVRAQLSGKPFLWHIYPQDEMAHLDKLDAFWRLPHALEIPQDSSLTATRMTCFQAAFNALSGDLNGAHELNEDECAAQWMVLLEHFDDWQTQARAWQQFLLAQSDAVSRLEIFLQSIPCRL